MWKLKNIYEKVCKIEKDSTYTVSQVSFSPYFKVLRTGTLWWCSWGWGLWKMIWNFHQHALIQINCPGPSGDLWINGRLYNFKLCKFLGYFILQYSYLDCFNKHILLSVRGEKKGFPELQVSFAVLQWKFWTSRKVNRVQRLPVF